MRRSVISLTCLSMVLTIAPAAAAADPWDGDPATTERIDASDPTTAAILMSQLRFGPDAAPAVILSRDDVFADSLGGSALTNNGPLLFTDSAELTDATRTEIDRILGSRGIVWLLGGENAISASIEAELAAEYDTERLSGPSRVETAIAVANKVREVRGGVYAAVARAYGTGGSDDSAAWADSVTGGAYAASSATPILLSPTEAMHPATKAWLDADQPQQTILYGGTSALSAAVEAAAPNPRRVSGGAREDTAVAIAKDLFGSPTSGARRFVIIDGYRADGWAYGLAAASLAGLYSTPILLVHPDVTPQSTLTFVTECSDPAVDLVLVGSTSVIAQARQDELDSVDGTTCQ